MPPSEERHIRVLIVENYSQKAADLLLLMQVVPGVRIDANHVQDLSDALARLKRKSYDVILFDLSISNDKILDSFPQIYSQVSEIPILLVNGPVDHLLATKLIREGAEDYLVESDLDAERLGRSLMYSIERHRLRTILQYQSLNDELTCLLNRRGFWSLASQHIKIARRAQWEFILIFADLDGLKQINDTYGHPEGDQALRAVAKILKDTFRTSDVIARIGGDEFVVLAINTSSTGIEAINTRLQESLNLYNLNNSRYALSMSFGVAKFDPQSGATLEEMIAAADMAMFEDKRKYRGS